MTWRPDTTRTSARRRTFGAVAVVALLVLSACGGAEGDGVASAGGVENPANPGATDQTAPSHADAQALVFAECMRDNGIDMRDPGPGQQGLVEALQSVSRNYDRKTIQQALSACQDLMPQYAQEHPTGDDWQLDLAECLREQGLDVSDNPFSDAHSGAVDVNEFAAAMEVCRDVLTGGGQ
jgi:hypothetical protein